MAAPETVLHDSAAPSQTNANNGLTWTWSAATAGTHVLEAVVVDSLGRRWPATNLITIHVYDQHPSYTNDWFAQRTVLTANTNILLSLDSASSEPGEPGPVDHSVWFEWKSPTDGRLQISRFKNPDYPTPQIDVFAGSSLLELQPLAGNQVTNRWIVDLNFPTTAGQSLQIRISSITNH